MEVKIKEQSWCLSEGGKEGALRARLEAAASGLVIVVGKGEKADPSQASGSDPQRTRGGSRKTGGPDRARGERRTWCRKQSDSDRGCKETSSDLQIWQVEKMI